MSNQNGQADAVEAVALDDPLLTQQWAVLNPNWPAVTLNLLPTWADYSGRGVTIAVVDDGVDYLHPDLAGNYDVEADWDALARDDDAWPDWSFQGHGTIVAGVIGAVAGNGLGMVGIAHGATLAGFRKGNDSVLTGTQLTEIFSRQGAFDVSNNSWLYTATGYFDALEGELAEAGAALADAAANGRGGLGTVFVFPAGNNAAAGQRADYHGFQTSPWTITVGGLGKTGLIGPFSNPGASVLVSAGAIDIVTTDRTGAAGYVAGDYVSTIVGTSLATAQVSGVVALMLEANPHLGLRDVHEILAYSAWNPVVSAAGWQTNGAGNWNGGGLAVSHSYGFGLVDALAAVRLAETWDTQRTIGDIVEVTASANVAATIADAGSLTRTVTVAAGVDIDQVLLSLDIEHGHIGDLVVRLTSPDGTSSTFVDRPGRTTSDPDGIDRQDLHFTFSSVQFWGENGAGDWTLSVSDDLANGLGGTLKGWSVTLLGDAPSDDDTYFYTREWLRHADEPVRNRVVDIGGNDTLNFSALSGSYALDLAPGAVGVLLGKTFRIGTGTLIENAIGGDGATTFFGNDAGNRLDGGRGDDRLEGRNGDDRLIGGPGADLLIGGAGYDTADYAVAPSAVFVRLASGDGQWGDAQGDALSGIESLVGSAFDDSLGGDEADNRVDGGAGDDLLTGHAGSDLLIGGAGADLLDGGDGIDTADYSTSAAAVFVRLWAGYGLWSDAEGDRLARVENLTGSAHDDMLGGDAGTNVIEGGDGDDFVYGNAGDDQLSGGAGDDVMDGEAGADDIAGGAGDDIVYGDQGGDRLDGGGGADSLWGESGDDILIGGAGTDRLDGGTGDDTADYSGSPGAVLVQLYDGQGRFSDAEGDRLSRIDNLVGSGFDDILIGGTSDNRIEGGAGADLIDGGGGNDTADYSRSPGAVVVRLWTGAGHGADAEGDRIREIDELLGSAFDDVLAGNESSNRLEGGAGADLLNGHAGADLLIGGAGADQMDGGDGIDTADYSAAAGGVFVRLWAGVGLWSDAEGDRLSRFENLIGSAFDDMLAGTAGDNFLVGGTGDDLINGYSGDDWIVGGPGADAITGGDGTDKVDYSASPAAVQVRLWAGVGTGGDADGDRLSGLEVVTGSRFGDVIAGADGDEAFRGGDGDDLLSGHGGNDLLEGGDGNDRLIGGAGADILSGGRNNDYADYSTASGPVFVRLWAGDGQWGDAEGDRLTGIEMLVGSAYADALTGDAAPNRLEGFHGDDLIDGREGNDRLIGGDGADILSGQAGDDRLIGDAGADRLDGGAGTDVADYSASSGAVFVRLWTGTGEWSDAEGDRLTQIENLIGTAFDDALAGDAGDNRVEGGRGADVINGNAGADFLIGGAGIDRIDGQAGDDRIDGGDDADTIVGGTGDDWLIAGAGADYIDGGAGIDTVDYLGASAAVFVRLWAGTGEWGDADGDRLVGIENIVGTRFDDVLAGDDEPNRLDPGEGRNIVNGHGGDDWFVAHDRSSSRFDGGDGVDTIDYSHLSDAISLRLWTPGPNLVSIENVVGTAFNDAIGGDDGANRIDGGSGTDLINGHGGDDVLIGGAGSDRISGNDGVDTLFGGDGDDIFMFNDGAGHDAVMDFEAGDRLDFSLVGAIGSYQTFIDAATEVGEGVQVVFGGGGVTIFGMVLADFQSSDLIF